LTLKKILEAIVEVDFRDVSYGFRPNPSCNDAQDMVDKIHIKKSLNYVVGMDIVKFFDVVCHKCLMKCRKQRIVDPRLLRIIARFLKSGVMVEGKYLETCRGTPQGGILSLILANIVSHYVLDRWFESMVKKPLTGFALLVRYTDDFIVCFQSGWEARAFGKALWKRLAKFRLTISEEKSRNIEFGRYACQQAKKPGKKCATFDFFGFTHFYILSKRCIPEELDEGNPQVLFCEGAHSNPGAITPIGGGL
jgi:retron-type reverse transcriptase